MRRPPLSQILLATALATAGAAVAQQGPKPATDEFAVRGQREARAIKYGDREKVCFKPGGATKMVCRTTISVGYRGEIYDCDFNQMLNLQRRNGRPLYLWDITPDSLTNAEIITGIHCLACTAGCGSSCGGAVV